MARLAGKVAIITGGARGQGAAHAEQFVREGARVVIGDVLDEEGAEVARRLGDAARYVHLDVTDPEMWDAAVGVAVASFGLPNVLVNNAAVMSRGSLIDVSLAEFRRVIDVNLIGQWLGIKTVAPAMIECGVGSVINLGSIISIRSSRGAAAYAPAKTGVLGLTRLAALELGPQGIRVNTILPGHVLTPMLPADRDFTRPELWDGQAIPRIGMPADVAHLAVFLASDESAYCTGSEFVVDGGASLIYRVPSAVD
ncbi:MAG TPA: glucose 1-dehydrogenase [Ilumatobacteraceae bacterium]